MKKVFLLDDHKIIRDGIKSILAQSPTYSVTGEEGDPDIFLDRIDQFDFDILLLDLNFPRISGLDLIPKVKKLKPKARIIILSMHKSADYMQRTLLLGADCYLPKDIDSNDMLLALDTISSGGQYRASSIPEIDGKETESATNNLSVRENEILKLIAEGFSSKQIALKLTISARTVEAHRLNLMKKLGTSNSAETISVAVKMKIL